MRHSSFFSYLAQHKRTYTGTAITPEKVKNIFSGGRTAFQYPEGRKLKIRGVVPPEVLAKPDDMIDSEGWPCIVVGKDGSTTGLTFGSYAGLESFVSDDDVESIELGIYNLSRDDRVFSDYGDSGALIWDSLGRVLGQLHSGQFKKKNLTWSHIMYATPGWWLLQRIKARYPDAIFFRDTWSESA